MALAIDVIKYKTGRSTAEGEGGSGSTVPLSATTASEGSAQQVIDKNSAVETFTSLRFPLDTPQYWFSMSIHDYHRNSWREVGTMTFTENIILPLPTGMVDKHSVSYEEKELGIAGMAYDQIAGPARQAMNTGSFSGTGLAGALGETVAGVGTRAGINAAGSLVGDQIKNAGLLAAGAAINDFLVVMLKGPTYKQHVFQWTMSPKNEKETANLIAINKLLNDAMAPGLMGYGSAFFSWPKIFQLQFRHPTADMGKNTYRFKKCVLSDMVWDFQGNEGNTWSAYSTTKAPETVKVMMKFTELEYWLKGDFV